MALRADQWMMIAVGGLGLTALYLLTQAKSDQPRTADIPIRNPGTTADPVIGPVVQPGMGPIDPGLPLTTPLRPGTWYRGRLELAPTLDAQPGTDRTPDFETFLTTASTREQIAARLAQLGFGDVVVYMNLAEAEPAVLIPDRLKDPMPGSRWFSARWVGRPGAVSSVVQRSRRFPYLWRAAGAPMLGMQTLNFMRSALAQNPGRMIG